LREATTTHPPIIFSLISSYRRGLYIVLIKFPVIALINNHQDTPGRYKTMRKKKNWHQRAHKRMSKKGKVFVAGRKKEAQAQARRRAAQAKKEGVEEFRKSDLEVGYAGATVRKRPSR